MSEFEFFLGNRVAETFSLSIHKGKAMLTCTIIERWEELFSRSLSCGTEHRRSLTRRVGISVSDREDLEATIHSSLGLKGLAELGSQIGTKLGRELQFQENEEVTEEFKFVAPQCGILVVLIYQLKRLFKFSFEDRRFLHRAYWTKTVSQWQNRLFDASKRIENDPACGCDPRPDDGIDGRITLMISDKVGILVGFKYRDGEIVFPGFNMSFPGKDIREILAGELVIEESAIPDYLRFLAGGIVPLKGCRFLPYSEWRFIEGRVGTQGRRTVLGPSVLVKGEVSSREDIEMDGSVEGVVWMNDSTLILGPASKAHADVVARNIIVEGSIKGNLRAKETVTITKDGAIVGDITASNVVIESGGYFKGSIEIEREAQPSEAEVKTLQERPKSKRLQERPTTKTD